MTELVHKNEHAEHEQKREDRYDHSNLYDDVSVRIVSSEKARAHASTARTSSSESGTELSRSLALSAASITPAIPGNDNRPPRNSLTATSFAALSTIGHAPPCFSASYASRRHGNRCRSGGKNSRDPSREMSSGATGPSHRSGCENAY